MLGLRDHMKGLKDKKKEFKDLNRGCVRACTRCVESDEWTIYDNISIDYKLIPKGCRKISKVYEDVRRV